MNLASYIIIGVFVLSGCNTTLHKDYRFEAQEQNLGWSVLHAKLRGKPTEINSNLSSTGSPYELLVWFSAKDKAVKDCEIILDSLSFVSIDQEMLILNKNKLKTRFRKKSDGNYIANYAFKDLELTYVDYKLQITYRSSIGCSAFKDSSTIEFVFRRDYQERKISFWDSLMGI